MIRLEYPKFNIDGLQDKEKLSTIKRQLDTLTNNIQLVLESISGDVEALSEFVGNSNEAENSENISTITETIGELEDRDYIVEQGTDGIWAYRKWNSGRAELWGKFYQTQTAYATNSWVIGDSSTTPYPFAITNPIAVATLRRFNTGGGAILTFDYERTDYWSAIVTAVVGSYPQGTSANLSWYVYVNARWK